MTNSKHTPGPWKYIDKGIISEKIQTYGGFVVLEMPRRDEFTKEDEANASLIAAAPELLEACKAIFKAPYGGDDYIEAMTKITKAIAKAERR